MTGVSPTFLTELEEQLQLARRALLSARDRLDDDLVSVAEARIADLLDVFRRTAERPQLAPA